MAIMQAASAGAIGALLEWYDFYIFATGAALVFGPLFFPGNDPVLATMASFGAFAAGFLSRPLGAVLFGHIGDTMGRRASLLLTIVIVGIGTFLIGLLPTYQQIGLWAPLLLVTLRVVQGIGLGGEYAGASLITIEHAPHAQRGFWGSLPQAASPGGLLLATGVFGLVSLLPHPIFLAWGWRIPFLLSAVMLLVGIAMRLRVAETPTFHAQKTTREDTPPGLTLLRTHLPNVVLATGARLVETVSGNLIKSFGLTYVTLELKLPQETALTALMATAAVGVLATPCYGALGDRLGQARLYLTGGLFVALLAFPFFFLLNGKTALTTWVAFALCFNLGPTLLLSVQPTLFTRMFAPEVRYTGMSVAYQVSAIAGGFTPLAALWLLRRSDGMPWLVATALVAIALLSCACVTSSILLSRTRPGLLSP
jgi:MFS transporter, MHS family, shikimate and dehydroshikimate transport protein